MVCLLSDHLEQNTNTTVVDEESLLSYTSTVESETF
jgi:hypothetical protein